MLQTFNPKNKHLQIFVGDKLYPREEAKVSVFDSSVQGGDAVWEGLRVYKEGILCLSAHLSRLRASAHTLAFENIPDESYIRAAIRQTLDVNEMDKDSHIRLTLTRGIKITSGMDPRLNQNGCCLIVLAEWKPPVYDSRAGIKLITSSIRRNSPKFLDSKIHHANLLNNILAKIEANYAGCDAALMLDEFGFVAELNDTNVFACIGDQVVTPFAKACLPGITRNMVIQLCKNEGIDIHEKNLSQSELYNADTVFATGTMGELCPIAEIDGRKIENRAASGLFEKIQGLYRNAIPGRCERV